MSMLCDVIYEENTLFQLPLCFTRMVSVLDFLGEIYTIHYLHNTANIRSMFYVLLLRENNSNCVP